MRNFNNRKFHRFLNKVIPIELNSSLLIIFLFTFNFYINFLFIIIYLYFSHPDSGNNKLDEFPIVIPYNVSYIYTSLLLIQF